MLDDPGETYAQAALRELWEETGIKDVQLGPILWQSERKLVSSDDEEVMLFIEQFFLVRVADNAVKLDNLLEWEREVYRDHRWWTLNEIRQSDETFLPEGFAGIVAPFLEDTPIKK